MFARQVSVNCYSTGSANKMLRMDTVGIELFQKREREKERERNFYILYRQENT